MPAIRSNWRWICSTYCSRCAAVVGGGHQLAVARDDRHRRLEIVEQAREHPADRCEPIALALLAAPAREADRAGGLRGDQHEQPQIDLVPRPADLRARVANLAALIDDLDAAHHVFAVDQRRDHQVCRRDARFARDLECVAWIIAGVVDDHRRLVRDRPADQAGAVRQRALDQPRRRRALHGAKPQRAIGLDERDRSGTGAEHSNRLS
jgi:hypothetical protein